jgi:hypothetical protein
VVIRPLKNQDIFASMNQEIDISIAQSVAEKFGYSLEVLKPEQEKISKIRQIAKKPAIVDKKGQNLVERPPVVCVLGTSTMARRHCWMSSGMRVSLPGKRAA